MPRVRVLMRVALGIGCRAGRTADTIDTAIRAALSRLPDAPAVDIVLVATLDAKAGEPGLVECCARHGWPLAAFSRDAIAEQLARGLSRSPDAACGPSAEPHAGALAIDAAGAAGSAAWNTAALRDAHGAPFGEFGKPSVAARARFGVDGVCEPCALLAAPGGALIVRKLALDGVTVAIARVAGAP